MSASAARLYQPTSIAHAFLEPGRPWDRHHYYYARSKLATDPVYGATLALLEQRTAPVLDLGCGIGLLAHAMRNAGLATPYVGVDLDPAKIDMAERGKRNSGLTDARFAVRDIATDPLQHSGTVVILDVLQYLDEAGQQALLAQCAGMLGGDGALIIRSGLREDNARSRITRVADFFAHRVGWMVAAPRHFPTREGFERTLGALGLNVDVQPLRGRLGLNNWLVVGTR